jgi:hypothetical protein
MFRIALLATLLSATPALAAEPPQARLTIGENVYNVPMGKAFAVRIGEERVTLRIDLVNEKTFDAAGVSFRYPSALEAGESPSDEGVRVWTLQGKMAAVMLQQYGDDLDAKSLREVLVENLAATGGQEAEKPKTVRLTTPGRAYDGVQLNYTTPAKDKAPATVTVQNLFTFASDEGVFALMVQDVRPQGEGESAEYTETLRLLGESLKTGDEPQATDEAAPAESVETK